MAGSRPRIITRKGRKAIDAAVREAERDTGLQFCVYLGPSNEEDSRAHAEGLFVQAGLHERPAVLLLVAPSHRKAEVVTSSDSRNRIPDDECVKAVEAMTPYFARGEFVDGLLVGIRELAERAGPGTAPPGGSDLPNVVG